MMSYGVEVTKSLCRKPSSLSFRFWLWRGRAQTVCFDTFEIVCVLWFIHVAVASLDKSCVAKMALHSGGTRSLLTVLSYTESLTRLFTAFPPEISRKSTVQRQIRFAANLRVRLPFGNTDCDGWDGLSRKPKTKFLSRISQFSASDGRTAHRTLDPVALALQWLGLWI